MEDSVLIDLFFCRSQDAITKTAKKYGRLCYGISYNVVGVHEDAEECVNDSYLALWDTIPPNRPESFVAYLSKIVRNISLKKLRSNRSQKRSGQENVCAIDELDEILGGANSLEDEVDAKALSLCIDRFLRDLVPALRIAFMERYFFGDSVKQIAKNLGKSEGAVKMILLRTREKLRECLIKEGFLNEEGKS